MNIYEQLLISCRRMKKALIEHGVKGVRRDINKMSSSDLLNFHDELYDKVQEWEDNNNMELNY